MFNSVIYCGIFAAFINNVVAISEEQQAQIHVTFIDAATECIKDHPVSFEDLTSFRDKVFPDHGNGRCFAACVFKEIGIFDDKGTLSHTTALEKAKKIFEDEEELKSIEKFLITCAKVNDEDVNDDEQGCERAKLAYECYAENYKKFDFDLNF